MKPSQRYNNPKQEAFYTQKRGLIRKAEQVNKTCNADVFVVIHHKESDKLFSFSTEKDFKLENISQLVIDDLLRNERKGCKINMKPYIQTNFQKVKQNITQVEQITTKRGQLNKQNLELLNKIEGVPGHSSTEHTTQSFFKTELKDTPCHALDTSEIWNTESEGLLQPKKHLKTQQQYQEIYFEQAKDDQQILPLCPSSTSNEKRDIISIKSVPQDSVPNLKMKDRFKQTKQSKPLPASEKPKVNISNIYVETCAGSKSYSKFRSNVYSSNVHNQSSQVIIGNKTNNEEQDFTMQFYQSHTIPNVSKLDFKYQQQKSPTKIQTGIQQQQYNNQIQSNNELRQLTERNKYNSFMPILENDEYEDDQYDKHSQLSPMNNNYKSCWENQQNITKTFDMSPRNQY